MRLAFPLLVAILIVGCGSNKTDPTPAVNNPDGQPQPKQSVPPPASAENPEYMAWAFFPVGTSITVEFGPGPGSDTKQTLVEKTAEGLVLDESITVRGPASFAGPSGKRTVPKVKPASVQTPEFEPGVKPSKVSAEGSETVTIDGKKYLCTWYEIPGVGNLSRRVWFSKDIPGGIANNVMQAQVDAVGTKRMSAHFKTTKIEIGTGK